QGGEATDAEGARARGVAGVATAQADLQPVGEGSAADGPGPEAGRGSWPELQQRRDQPVAERADLAGGQHVGGDHAAGCAGLRGKHQVEAVGPVAAATWLAEVADQPAAFVDRCKVFEILDES